MSVVRFALIMLAITFGVASCAPREDEDTSALCWESGDILVSNSGSDAVVALKSDGSFRGIVYNVINTSETVYGVNFSASTGELLVGVDGTDRVMAISQADCSSRIAVADANLTGTIRGVTELINGDILVAETSNVERFRSNGTRVTTGGWPRALQTGANGLSAIAAGGFVHCSSTLDVVRTYDDAGVQVATRSSGIVATTDAMDCLKLSDGSVAIAWSGTTDTVSIVSADLSTQSASYSDVAILANPGGLAELANGNLIVADRLNHYLVEITRTGTFVGTLGDGVLNTPEFIAVAP